MVDDGRADGTDGKAASISSIDGKLWEKSSSERTLGSVEDDRLDECGTYTALERRILEA